MQTTKQAAFKHGRAEDWTRERIERLDRREIQQLRDNATRLGEAELASLCGTVLSALPRSAGNGAGAASRRADGGRRLLSRAKAFETRGVHLVDARTSWGGTRKADGAVVMALWSSGIESRNGGCAYLLWAPNEGGSRPWSDMAAGRERLQHCEQAIAQGGAEGLLAYGERLQGRLPEEKALSVHGIDPGTSFRFTVERRGAEYWAVWGKKES